MKPLLLTALIALAIGLYPEYAIRLVHAAERLVCSFFPGGDRSVIGIIVIVIAIGGVTQWKLK